MKVSDFSPAVIKRGLGRGKTNYLIVLTVGRIGLSMPCFQQFAHTSLSMMVPLCLRPLRVTTPASVVIDNLHPQRLHCHIPSGRGIALMRSMTACLGLGSVGETRCSGIAGAKRLGVLRDNTQTQANGVQHLVNGCQCRVAFSAQGFE